MGPCTVCGNEYDKAFRVITADDEEFLFDSIECAAHRLAPTCERCGCRIIGHGVESNGRMFCCAHCARDETDADVRDRDDTAS